MISILAATLSLGSVALSAGPKPGDERRPYEMVLANRRTDEVPAVLSLESAEGWHTEGIRAEASVTTAVDRLLFGDGVMRIDYRATGTNPVVRVLLDRPVTLPAFDTFSFWIYGNNFFSLEKPHTPQVQVYPCVQDVGGMFELPPAHVHHTEWSKFQYKVPSSLSNRTMRAGCRFLGWRIAGGTNATPRRLDFTSVCAWQEKLKPISFEPRAKRGIRLFPRQEQGVNTGDGSLPFPTVDTTIIPVVPEDPRLEFRFPVADGIWDDLAFRIDGGEWIGLAQGGGVWPRSAAARAKAKFRRIGDSVVADLEVPQQPGDEVEEVRFGGTSMPKGTTSHPVPFYCYAQYSWDDRPRVLATEIEGKPVFVMANVDWYVSGASEPFSPWDSHGVGAEYPGGVRFLPNGYLPFTNVQYGKRVFACTGIPSNGGTRYRAKTDGRRNDVFERFVWTVSRTFEGCLPEIPNPPSPYKAVTGTRAWTANQVRGDRSSSRRHYRKLIRQGMNRLFCTDHETMWRDAGESFTFRTNAAPAKGGDAAQYEYTRWMIETNGFWYGPYNNFTDLAPVNEHWHSDHLQRASDGNFFEGWARCYAPKPLYGLEMCDRLTPVNQGKFHFTGGYCDVTTAVSPWDRTDYDARVPGAATFAQTFYAYGEILLLQRRHWQGPVSSEGRFHAYYAGLADQNYAQDSPYDFTRHPWILDFVLRKINPKSCDHGPYTGMLFGDVGMPKDIRERVDFYLAYQLAYGFSAFLLPERQPFSYYMNLAIASLYTQESVRSIRYLDESGRLLTTSQAVLSGRIARNQSVVSYSAGTDVIVNGSTCGEDLTVSLGGGCLRLPPMGVFARGKDTVVWSGRGKTCRQAFCRAADYLYLDARGGDLVVPGGATDGEVVRLKGTDGTDEVIPLCAAEEWTYFEVPYRAMSVVGLDEENRREVGPVPFEVTSRGWSRVMCRPGAPYSYRLKRPSDFVEPSSECYESCVKRRDK